MSLVLTRSAGDSSFILLVWTDDDGDPVDISIPAQFDSIVLQWERAELALLELAVTVDDGPAGLGHFTPSPAEMIAGSHKLRVKGIVAATSEEQYFPDEVVCLEVSPALKSNN